jgi:hypothetical protein
MSQVLERRSERRPAAGPRPDAPERSVPSRGQAPLRILGALTLLAVGAVHLEQYFRVHFDVVPVIGPLFLLNFIGATAVAAGLLLPLGRLHVLLALGAVAMSVVAFVFLFVSESRPLFGFEDYGYRPAIVIALAAEAATAVLLAGWLASRRIRGDRDIL